MEWRHMEVPVQASRWCRILSINRLEVPPQDCSLSEIRPGLDVWVRAASARRLQLSGSDAGSVVALSGGRECRAMPSAGWKKLSAGDLALAQKWFAEGLSAAACAQRLGRWKSTLARRLVKQHRTQAQGGLRRS